MSVDIQSTTGSCLIQGDAVSGQGLYLIPSHTATINEVVATADATNPRIDQVILEVLDNTHDASGSNLARTRVLTGTPTVGATLNNRSGATALPNSAMRLADILVPAASSSVVTANIRDRRTYARGFHGRQAASTADYTTTASVYAPIDSTNLSMRVEANGNPLRLELRPGYGTTNTINTLGTAFFADAGGGLTEVAGSERFEYFATISKFYQPRNETVWTPAPGSYRIVPEYGKVDAGTATFTLGANATSALMFEINEILPSADNGTS
jgi:hypothetical protein